MYWQGIVLHVLFITICGLIFFGYIIYHYVCSFIYEKDVDLFSKFPKSWNLKGEFTDSGEFIIVSCVIFVVLLLGSIIWPVTTIIGIGYGILIFLRHLVRKNLNEENLNVTKPNKEED